MEKLTYNHGLPFSESLADDVIKPCIENMNRNPSILIIDGAPGTGKTTLAIHMMDYTNKRVGKPPVSLEKDSPQLAMGGKDLNIKAPKCSELGLPSITFDEADLDKMGAITRYNRELMGFFREYRTLKILIIIIIQNVYWLDKKIFELGAVEGLIHLYDPQDEYTHYSVYDMENLSWLLFRMDKNPRQARKAYAYAKGYMRGTFLDLESSRRALLGALSDTQKKKSRKKRVKRLKS